MMARHAARDTPLYAEIAQRLADQIERGTYRVGDAIPSIRAGSKLFGVSAGTLLEAYQQLEDRGYVRARPQSGYYVRQRPSAALSPPPNAPTSGKPREVHIDLAVEMLRRMADRDLLQLGAAVPDASFLPAAALNKRMTRTVRIHDRFVHAYGPPAGLPVLRQRLARFMADAGCDVGADNLVVTNGCTEAVSLCLRAVAKPGDTVAIESPAYYGLLFSLKALGLHALPIETSVVTGLSVDALERAACRHRIAAVAITPSFANPTGSCMPETSRRRLVEWARRTETPVIEDDIYGELHFEEQRPRPLFAFDSAGLVLYCASTSKTLSPGLRVGWCAPGRFLPKVEELKVGVNPTSNVAAQFVLGDFLESGGAHKHFRRLRRRYREQVDRFCESLTRHVRSPILLQRPAGGHLLWVEMPRSVDAMALFEQALTRKVSIAPGMIFSPDGRFRHHVRLNIAVPWTPKVDRALGMLGRFIDDFASPE